jgi:tetratricopeptide (TPR) repeat protein
MARSRRPSPGSPQPPNASPASGVDVGVASTVQDAPAIRRVDIALLVVAGVLVYANSIGSPKVIDDVVSIDGNPQIRDLLSLAVFMPERELPIAGRPLVNLTLAINYAIDGVRQHGYRVVNLMLHIACSVALLGTLRRLLVLPGLSAMALPVRAIALTTSLLWLVHPLNSEVVNYLTQRTETMMALFLLLTVYASMRALDEAGRGGWTAAAVACAVLGALCKESMATVPVLVALVDRVLVFPSWAEAWRRRRSLYAGLAVSWIVVAGILATGPRIRSTGFSAGVDAWTYLLNQSVMVVRYLRLAVWPDALVVYYGFPQPLAIGDVLVPGSVVVLLLLVTLLAFFVRPWLGLAGAWFFITLSPTSSIVPIVTEVGAERRMYLPLLALILPLSVWIWRTPWSRWVPVAVTAVLATALGATTIARNLEYRDPLVLAERTLERWPSPVAHHMVGDRLLQAGRIPEGVAHLRQAVEGAPRAHFTLGAQLYESGELDEAVVQLRQFIEREPVLVDVPEAHFLIGSVYAQRQQWIDAAAELRQAVAKDAGHLRARRALADVYFKAENVQDAARAYDMYLALRPDDVAAWTNFGISLAAAQRSGDAVRAFERAVALGPGNGEAYRNLATALLDVGRSGEAEVAARRAVSLRPSDAVVYELLAQALSQQGRQREANEATAMAAARRIGAASTR